MAKTTSYANSVLLLIFNNTSYANVGDATGIVHSTTAGSLFVSLHTADPTAAGTQTSNETAYTSYARVAVARSSAGWTVTTNSVSPTAAIVFPACTGSTSTITHFGVGTATSGAGILLYSGTVTANISVATGVTPQLSTATAITES